MFYGTKFWYRGVYFLTAMSPAYILFILQIHDSFKNKKGNLEFFKWEIEFNIYWMCALILFFFVILASIGVSATVAEISNQNIEAQAKEYPISKNFAQNLKKDKFPRSKGAVGMSYKTFSKKVGK